MATLGQALGIQRNRKTKYFHDSCHRGKTQEGKQRLGSDVANTKEKGQEEGQELLGKRGCHFKPGGLGGGAGKKEHLYRNLRQPLCSQVGV